LLRYLPVCFDRAASWSEILAGRGDSSIGYRDISGPCGAAGTIYDGSAFDDEIVHEYHSFWFCYSPDATTDDRIRYDTAARGLYANSGNPDAPCN
jgi:hypothetical protein